jgi:hypothetical protein
VVVEDDLLHVRVACERLEVAEAARGDGLDDDEAADSVELQPGRVDELELVRVQARELAHVAVQRAG